MEIFHGVRTVRLDVPNSKLLDIAKIDDVASLSEVPELEFCNNIARQVMRADIKINETVYEGKDQIITIADTGLDAGEVSDGKIHNAFKGRVVQITKSMVRMSALPPLGMGLRRL